ncbi:MAG: transketolase [Chloroflexi bacterium]|nr:MAG: transketolase [Chloroflexota bacterium]
MIAPVSILGYADLGRLMDLQLGDEKHTPSATSTLDVIWVLYDRVLRVAPERTTDPDRDRFLLSKGHGPMAYYAVLAAKGFMDVDTLRSFGRYDSPLGHHPDRNLVAGIEISSGSLGHGLGLAVGLCLGLRARQSPARVFCLVGDAELEEGSNHEAIAYAGRTGLDRLVCVVVDNRSSSLGWPGGLRSRFAIEGWSTATVDGRDHDGLERAFKAEHPRRPHAVVAEVEPKS